MENKKRYIRIICIAAGVLIALVLILVWVGRRSETETTQTETPLTSTEPDRRIVVKEVDKIVEVDKEFTSTTLQDGLRDMGVLITQEYYFTQVMSYSTIKQFLTIELPFTESSYIASYDGTVEAGLDFNKIKVTKDKSNGIITVYVPKSTIQTVSVDPDSFVLYQESSGIANPVSISDYNTSLSELEKNAREKAIDKGVLDKADANAQSIIRNFIREIAGSDYTIVFKTLG